MYGYSKSGPAGLGAGENGEVVAARDGRRKKDGGATAARCPGRRRRRTLKDATNAGSAAGHAGDPVRWPGRRCGRRPVSSAARVGEQYGADT
jgi:hypothetical protein